MKSPGLDVTERILDAAGYGMALVAHVHFERRADPGVRPFWVPDRLWRGALPECFTTIVLQDPARFRRVQHWDLRYRPQRPKFYEMLLRRGEPDELRDWIDGALLVDLWKELQIPLVIRDAWLPAVNLASKGPVARPWYGPAARPLVPGAR